MDEDLFWVLDYYPSDHERDAISSIKRGQIVCIVDEVSGGIIAYVLSQSIAYELVNAANQQRKRRHRA